MNKKLWFRAKTYGWGWSPATWQGWTITGLYCLYTIFLVSIIGDSFESRAGVTSFVFLMFLGAVPLFILCYRYGEEPKWRWGKKKRK